jgi:hypothetical protein
VLLQSLTIACPGIMALPLNAIAVMLCVAAAATCFATFKYAFSSCSIAVASMRSCCAMNDPAVSSIHGRLAHLLMVVAHANVAAAAAAYACCCCCVFARLAKIALQSSETNQEQQAGSAQHENTHVQQCHGDDSRSSTELLQG